MRNQHIAGLKAAHTRKVNALNERVKAGEITTQQAAGFKANAKRVLNQKLAEAET